MQVGRIVITGSTGFIGSHLVGHILSKGRPVTVILRPDSDTSKLKNFKGYNFVVAEDYADPTLARKLIDQNCDYFLTHLLFLAFWDKIIKFLHCLKY